MSTCKVCNRDFKYDHEQGGVGYAPDLCGPLCDGIDIGRKQAKAMIVNLREDICEVPMTKEERDFAVSAAYWLTASEHEWTWSQKEQVAMAKYTLWAAQRLEAIQGLAVGEPLRKANP